MDNSYPNLMCFGREPYECGCQEACQDFEECKETYYDRWFSFMENKEDLN